MCIAICVKGYAFNLIFLHFQSAPMDLTVQIHFDLTIKQKYTSIHLERKFRVDIVRFRMNGSGMSST